MAIFLLAGVPAAVAWLSAAAVSVRGIIGVVALSELYPVVRDRLGKKWDELGPSILQFAMDKYGLNMDVSKGINDESLTAMVNANLLGGTGLQLDSVLNRDKARKGFERIALQQVTERMGLPGVTSLAGARSALQDWLTAEVGAQLAAEAGDVIDVATGRAKLAARIALSKNAKSSWNTPYDMTNKGIKNRERQKKYRQNHKKYWVQR